MRQSRISLNCKLAEIKVRAGKSAMDATVLEIAKDGVRVQLSSGLAMIVRAEHLQF